MEKEYFLISSGDSGITIEQLTKGELESRISDGYYGNPLFCSEVPDQEDGYFAEDDKVLIVKGEIVTPRPVEIVRKYTLP